MIRSRRRHALTVAIVAFIVLLFVPAYISAILYVTYNNLTAQAYTQQQTLSYLAGQALEAKLNQLSGIAAAMASKAPLVNDVAAGDWTASVAYVRDLLNDVNFYDPYIDRITIVDGKGIQQGAYPSLTGGIGLTLASSGWYQAIQNKTTGVVSNVTKRISMPQILVVNVVAPVLRDGAHVGYVVLQIPTDHFLQFEQVISPGAYGFAYVVDAKGNVVAHPRYSNDTADVVNLSTVPEVAAVKDGAAGVLVTSVNGEPSVVAYKPVSNYQWGIVTQEPLEEAFGVRNAIAWSFSEEILAAILIDIATAYLLYKFLKR